MLVVDGDPFLPRVNVVPRSVMSSAVARALQGFYAELLEEPLPDNLTALAARLDNPSEEPR